MSEAGRIPEPEYMDDSEEALAYAEADFAEVNQAFVDRLVELAGSVQRARALDLGTGPGEIPIRLAAARPGWKIVAVDASEAMLDHARRLAKRAGVADAIEFRQADAKNLPPGDDEFDVVFSNSILHHITDTGSLWAEVARVASSGALVFFRDLARPDTPADARRLVETHAGEESELLKEEFYRSLLSAYTPGEVREHLAAAGLDSLNVSMVTDRHFDIWGRTES